MTTENAPENAQDAILTAQGPQGLSVDPAAALEAHGPWQRCYDPCPTPEHAGWSCSRCHERWQGDTDTGGCTTRLLALAVVQSDQALAVLGGLYDRAAAERDAALARAHVAENAEATRLIQLEEMQARVTLLEAEREDRLDAVRTAVKAYSVEVSEPLWREAEDRVALLEGLLRETLPYVEESLIGGYDTAAVRLLDRVHATLDAH